MLLVVLASITYPVGIYSDQCDAERLRVIDRSFRALTKHAQSRLTL